MCLEAKLQASIGLHEAHHTCSNRICVNPDHLALETHNANTAEMKERNYYIKRILELEEALRLTDPDNAALKVISIV